MKQKQITKKQIDSKIKHLNIEITYTRGDGYFYFTDLETEYQVGEIVHVCYLNHLSLERWIEQAEQARKDQNEIDEANNALLEKSPYSRGVVELRGF